MAKKPGELTPMMKQFYDFKAKHPDALLLFRCGDFYETYCDDAEEAAKILGITLTRRNNGASAGDAMAGFPYHALDTYLPRLIRAGRRVAICDQLEDPKKTKTLVKRGITELVTPGIAMQDNVLQDKENNFLAAVYLGKGAVGVALLDISTGEFLCGEGNYDYALKVIDNFQPKEVLYDRSRRNEFIQHFPSRLCTYELDDWVFTLPSAEGNLKKHFNVRSLKGFGVEHLKNGITAAGAIIQYLYNTEHHRLGHITRLQRLDTERYVRLDSFTIRSLELLQPIAQEGVSLLDIIDQTATAMGGRLLRRWITFPLKDVKQIDARQNIVEYYFRNPEFRDIVDEQLHRIADLERIIGKISTRRVNPREMRQLMLALDAVQRLKYNCQHTDNADLMLMADRLDPCLEMKERIAREIVPEPPLLLAKGGFIQQGVDEELDQLREIQTNGKAYLLKIQQREAERTGITSLKIGFNNVFGYYLEVRNTFKDNVPEEWIRKQTLAQAERYVTQELKDYEDKILSAETRIIEIEQQLFDRLVTDCGKLISQIQQDAVLVAQLDCLLSFALTARQYRYVRPVVDDSLIIDIHAGRHPVIETQLPVGEQYVPNDVRLASPNPSEKASPNPSQGGEQGGTGTPPWEGQGEAQIMIITGPNMAGKSALLRQTALIVLLAQIGSFVPAQSARIGVVDRIFTRVGASDNLAAGESTFMVEMTEASNILNNVTDRSLVLFDELGRGTSTYDGISIAWAIVEYLASPVPSQGGLHTSSPSQRVGGSPRTLFATHYHELNEMEQHFPCIRNYNVSVMETDQKVIFLRKLVEGGSEHSFGIHVAEIAGMPKRIVKRANEILKRLEKGSASPNPSEKASPNPSQGGEQEKNGTPPWEGQGEAQLSFFQLDDPVLTQIRDTLLNLDVNNLTPLQALNKLNEIKGILKG